MPERKLFYTLIDTQICVSDDKENVLAFTEATLLLIVLNQIIKYKYLKYSVNKFLFI